MATVIHIYDDLDNLDADQRAEQWLKVVADDAVLACRGAGRHGFDKFRRDRKMPNTWAMPAPVPAKPGCFLIIQRCPDCRLVTRALLTSPGGSIDLPARWKYWRDPRYSVTKGSARVTPRMALAEETRRMNDDGWVQGKAAQQVPAAVLAVVLAEAGLRGRADSAHITRNRPVTLRISNI